jgi:Dolichyl-phosphate-mannose-protein mannosyltransferase
MSLTLPVLVCLACGFFLVRLGWSRSGQSFSEHWLAGSLTVGFGLGIFSVIFFLSVVLQETRFITVDIAALALLMAGFIWRRVPHVPSEVHAREKEVLEPAWLRRLVIAGFAISLCCALYSAVMRTLAYPHGDGWDAFAIWNLHARFLFRGGTNWRDGFTALLPWSHPDYPLLVPAAVAHFWTYLGHDSPLVPAVIGFLFTFSAAGLLFSALSILRGRTAALLGTTALLSTPSFVELGTSQYADVPLSFFYLATLVLLCLHDDRAQGDASPRAPGLLVLSGLAAGFAAWTKNEGQLFLCAMVLARLYILARDQDRPHSTARARAIVPLLIAIVPALFLIAVFKHSIVPPGDLFSDPSTALHKLLDPSRYWAITKWYVKGFFRFGRWLLIPVPVLMIGYYFAGGKEDHAARQTGLRTSILALALTLAGYFAVYLITPYDIYWHLRFSLSRLFLQLWPSAIFVFFLLVKSTAVSDGVIRSGQPTQAVNVQK